MCIGEPQLRRSASCVVLLNDVSKNPINHLASQINSMGCNWNRIAGSKSAKDHGSSRRGAAVKTLPAH